MFRTPAFLGFSMVRQNNRRLLVAVTYLTTLALMATVIIAPSFRDRSAVAVMCVFFAYCAISWAIFGRLVKDTVMPQLRGGQMTSLGLTSRRRRGEDEPDEREVTIRNAACFAAYRALAVYSIVLWAFLPLFSSFSPSTAIRLLQLVTMPLLTMALTLPQAVVLWTEPDVPEEAP